MFKKITSNRDPAATVFSELGKEFRPYISKVQSGFGHVVKRYPRFLFGMMIINIILSAILVMTVFKPQPDQPKTVKPAAVVPLTGGFDRIIAAGNALKQTIRLKKRVDSLTKNKQLSKADSAQLLRDLDSLQQISKPFNSLNHDH